MCAAALFVVRRLRRRLARHLVGFLVVVGTETPAGPPLKSVEPPVKPIKPA